MEISNEDFRKHAARTERPIPGQSLTDNPETPSAWEKPPQITTKEEAIDYFSNVFLDEETFPELMKLIKERVPIMDLVQMFLTQAFENGLVNPDLMMLLAEPLAYMLMGLAEQQDIKYIIMLDEDEDDEGEPDDTNIFRSKLQTIKNPQNDQEINLDEKIQNAPSLMVKRGET